MVQCLTYLLGGGATLGLVSILVSRLETESDLLGLLATVAGGYLLAALALIGFDRLPPWALQGLVASGVALVSLSLYFSGDARNDNEMFYVLASIYAFYFFTLRQAALQLVLVGAAYGAVLAVVDQTGQAAPGRWLIAMGTIAAAGITVRLLKQRVQQLVARLAEAARTDPLTGLLNRRGFDDVFEAELERVSRSGGSLSLLVGDLDRFKSLNDRGGHAAGDRALQRFGALLKASARRIDTPARIGGEEFALIVPDTGVDGAIRLAERLREEAAGAFAGEPAPLTVSFGIAVSPDQGQTVDDLLQAADRALYDAKELGRNRCEIYRPERPDINPSLSTRSVPAEGPLAPLQ